jgi:hypothetical protein
MIDMIKFAFRDVPSAGVTVFVLMMISLLISELTTKICTVIFISKAAMIVNHVEALKKTVEESKAS